MEVRGGTETPGIDPAVFAMPEGMAIRYDQPNAAIADYITGYHVYAGAPGRRQVDWFLPGTANLRVTLGDARVAVRIGNHRFDPTPQASLYGPTSRALEATTAGGVMVGIGISALGWARLGRRPARDVHNRIVPAAQVLPPVLVDRIVAALATVEERAVAHTLDALLAPALARPHPDEALIRSMIAVAVNLPDLDIASAAVVVGTDSARLRRLALRHFGLTPKLLFRRTRFLRSFLQLWQGGDIENYRAIDPSYFDASHFLRDAYTFLGTTPRRFLQQPHAFLAGSVRARAAVLGAPTQALHGART